MIFALTAYIPPADIRTEPAICSPVIVSPDNNAENTAAVNPITSERCIYH